MSTFHAPAPVDKTRTYWPSPSERTDAKKLCVCGTPITNYDQYNRSLRSKLVGCCCNTSPCTVANMYASDLCVSRLSSSSIQFGVPEVDTTSITFTATPITMNGDFTVEWFQYLTGDNPYPHIFSELDNTYNTDNYFACSVEGGLFLTVLGDEHSFGGFTSYTDLKNKWVHFAFVRRNGVIYAYMNGVQLSSGWSKSDPITIDEFMIGAIFNGGEDEQFIGYITNFRLVNGYAVYSCPFPTPVSTLTDIPGTQILLLAKTAATVSNNSASAQSPISTQPSGAITWSPAF